MITRTMEQRPHGSLQTPMSDACGKTAGEISLYRQERPGGGGGPDPRTRHQSKAVGGVVRLRLRCLSALRALATCAPSLTLHSRHMTRTLSSVSLPPSACGLMWSTSGERGASGRVQSKGRRQIGQGAPVSCAAVMACRRIRFHAPVPVREVAMSHPLGRLVGGG